MSHDYVEPCRQVLQALIASETVDSAILCNDDGLPVAHASSIDLAEDAMSAMSASLMALADAIVGQGGEDDKCRQVVMESARRTVAVIHAGNNMVLAVTGRPGMNFGMVISHANMTVDKILNIVAGSGDAEEIEHRAIPQRASLEELVKRVLQEVEEGK